MNKSANKKSLFIALIAIVVVVVLGLIVALAALSGIFSSPSSDKPTTPENITINASTKDLFNGFANVCDYGAVPNDGKDDTPAFKKAVETGINVFVPSGKYQIDDTITLVGVQIAGNSFNNTVIESKGNRVMFELYKGADVSQLTLRYATVSGKEKLDEKVAIKICSTEESQIDSYIHDIIIENVGTGIYSDFNGVVNNETFENVHINGFTAAGIYLANADRFNTNLRSIFLNDSKGAQYGITVQNGTAAVFEEIIFNNVEADEVMLLNSCTGFTVRTAMYDGVESEALLKLNNSIGTIGSIYDKASSGSVIKLCNIKKIANLTVDFIHVSNLEKNSKFMLIDADNLSAKCNVNIDSCTYDNIPKAFEELPCKKDTNLTVKKQLD